MTLVVFTPSSTEDAEVTPVGANLYRLESNPGPGNDTDLEYGDVFEAEQNPDGSLRVIRLAQKSEWRNYCWMLAKGALNYRAFHCFANQIVAAGGQWEVIMGGIFLVNLPPDSSLDPHPAWDACFNRFGETPASPEDLARVTYQTATAMVDLEARFGPHEET